MSFNLSKHEKTVKKLLSKAPANANKKKIADKKKRLIASNTIKIVTALRKRNEPSKTELQITEFLTSNNLSFKTEYCIKTKVDGKLRVFYFDFYIPDYNLLIEFDGIHHYQEVKKFGSKLSKVREHDDIKNNWAARKNIDLLRISCLDKESPEAIICKYLDKISPIV